MSKNILLSICIPTYNWPKKLKQLLKNIISQNSSDIEIVIGDDSNNLKTKEMIRNDFSMKQVRYYRNKHKEISHKSSLNFDKNVLSITKKARGKYVWWFGDEEIKPGAITYVLNIIKKNPEISLIWINFRGLNNLLPARNFGGDKFFKDKNYVLEEISNELGFLSSIVFKKDKILNINTDNMNRFIGSGFINIYLVMHILSQEGKFYYIDYPYIICHPTPIEKHSYGGFEVFGINFYHIVRNFENQFKRKSIKKMLAKNFGHVWRGILVCWLKGYDTPKGKFKNMFKFYWNFPEFLIAGPLFLMPKFVTKFFYFVYKKILRRVYGRLK
ncbi:glycosyltransferase family 2 protein [Candidatus Wolfebacteria bacterium]|nr:glycosyltransferase family 2 protein [Candidatus Wolfebacteria bacterium]